MSQIQRMLAYHFVITFVAYLSDPASSSKLDPHSIELENALHRNPPRAQIFLLNKTTSSHKSSSGNPFTIYCYDGERYVNPKLMWTSATLRLVTSSEHYAVYRASNASSVYHQHVENSASWFAKYLPWRLETLSLSPFNETCVGVDTEDEYTVQFRIQSVDPWLLGYLCTGILLFISASSICRNMFFYYSTGISVGLLASLLILVYVLSRFVPTRSGPYVVMAAGWSVSAWLLQYLWENVQSVLENYFMYVMAYFLLATVISWAVCYYRGPPSNPRIHNLMQWLLQAVALVFIYNSTQIREISITLVIVIVIWYNFTLPSIVPLRFKSIWLRWFPPKVKLLSAEQYMKQGQVETKRALDELRTYCRSPDCDAWRTVSRLHSPNRFAKFIEGDPHVSDDEISWYENDPGTELIYMTDDEDEIDFRLNSH